MIICVAAILFPFRMKHTFESSPANIRVGGIPLISIAGVISLAFISLIQYFWMTNPLYGANFPAVWLSIDAVLVVGLVIYVVSEYHRERNGIDLSLAFKEIPPE
jgi:hypothetical protein